MNQAPGLYKKLEQAAQRHNSLLCLRLAPDARRLPPRHQSKPHPHPKDLLAWMQAVIEATADRVCAYVLDYPYFEALAMPGLDLLHATLAHIPTQTPRILDAQRSATGASAIALAKLDEDIWSVDGVTVNIYTGPDMIAAYEQGGRITPLAICRTNQPAATDLQMLEISDWQTLDREPNQPLYVHVARTALRWARNTGLVVSATAPDALGVLRHSFPEQWFLVTDCAQAPNAGVLTSALWVDGMGGMFDESSEVSGSADYRSAADWWVGLLNKQRERRQTE